MLFSIQKPGHTLHTHSVNLSLKLVRKMMIVMLAPGGQTKKPSYCSSGVAKEFILVGLIFGKAIKRSKKDLCDIVLNNLADHLPEKIKIQPRA